MKPVFSTPQPSTPSRHFPTCLDLSIIVGSLRLHPRCFVSSLSFVVDAGRTYPLEGAAMIFPQHAPYTDPLRIIICGGSTPGPAQVLDNCVHIAPEDPDPQWTIERMASSMSFVGRVMLIKILF